nr:uncharacterized protein LOC113398114 [Vanessa tameamea]
MNSIQDTGIVLDFDRDIWYLRYDRTPQPLEFEYRPSPLIKCSSVGLRDDEGTQLNLEQKQKLSDLLNVHEGIFAPGGKPTRFVVHRIDTGDAAPIASPPYRVSPAKKEIIRKELDTMLEDDIIEDADSEWASPVVLIPKFVSV